MHKKALLLMIMFLLFLYNQNINAQDIDIVTKTSLQQTKKINLDDKNIILSYKNNVLTAEFLINNVAKLEFKADFYISIVSQDNKTIIPSVWKHIPNNNDEKYLPEIKINSPLTKDELKNCKLKYLLKSYYLAPEQQCFGKGGCNIIEEHSEGEKNISDLLN